MRKAKNFSNRLMAMLLSAAMIFAPILESMPVYAAEADAVSGNEASDEMFHEIVRQTGTGDADDAKLFSDIQETFFAASASDFSNVGGWNESIYAEIAGVTAADVTEVSYSGAMTGKLTGDDKTYLVRDNGNGGVRIDIPGLKAGTYTLTVKVGSSTLTKSGIEVYAYDRSGYAHFGYDEGVGAYNNDGTIKANAIVLYVTDKNKNDVTLTYNGITVKGIGNILNSVGQANSGGTTSNGGKPNTNQGIIRKLAEAGKPLVVRFIGCVSETGLYKKGTYDASGEGLIEGLTDYASLGNGGSVKDNGHMARIQSGKDITLEGIGYDAVIDGWGFHYIAEGSAPALGKSFEVRNLTFINTPEDAVGMEGQQVSKNTSSDLSSSVERCWVHHNEFYCPDITSPSESDKSEGDGSVDFKRGQYFTCSYNYFEGCHKTNLVGSADYSLQFNLTYHHNYWYLCKARGPLARNANIHMYNNVVEMQTDYAQNTRANSYIFSEYNLFYACKSPQAVEGGAIKSYHDSISSVIWNKGSAGTVVEDKKAYVANACQFQARKIKYDKFDVDPELSYIPGNNYKLETDFTELRKVIVSQTGVQEQKPKLPEEVATSDYSVVPKGVTPTTFDSLPQNLTPGKISKSVYAFTVNAPFNLEVAYNGAPGVLVNEAGENLLTGNGELVNIPAGTYMIQAENFQPGDGKKGTTVVFKDMTISSLKIEACDPDAHYHKWVLDSSKTVAATCTETGKKVYTCAADLDGGECKETKEETVAALGHSYGGWKTDRPATETEAGEKSRSCTRCGVKETAPIPAGSTGGSTGDTSGGSTAAGDYVLTFEGLQKNDSSDFFTVTGSYSNSKGSTTVNGEKYSECLKMESKTKVSFSCNDGAKLFMAFASTESGKKVIVDGKEYTTDSAGTVTVELSAGKHEITKGDTINLFYVSVENGASSEVFYTLSFEYNYDDAPDAKTVSVAEGTSYASMSQLAPASFTRSDYVLDGLYTDASCTTAVTYPYTVSSNATFYADWKEGEKQEVTYSLIFNTNNGSAVATVQVSSSQIYTITQRPTRAGYTFAGWYDALEGGNVVDRIDGSALTGNITVYAHWNASEKMKNSLDVSKDFSELMNGKTEINITEKTTVGGFTIHALAGGVGTAGSENPKYYMTVKADKNNNNAMGLFTNGVRLTKTDADIAGNEDGLLKSLEFTAEGQGILTVDLALTASPEKNKQYDLVLVRKSTEGSLVEAGRASLATTGKTRATKTFDVEEAGTYYLYAEGAKGVVYYNLKLTEQVYTILYQVGAGTVPAGQGSVVAREGEEIQLPECTANPGYVFKGWSMDGGETMLNGSYTVKTDDVSEGLIVITAIYDVLTYTVKYDANGGQLPAGMEASVTAKAGERLTLGECTPKAGKKFAGWSVGSSDKVINNFYLVNAVDANKDNVITLKAVYKDNSKPNPEKTGLQVELKNPDETYTYTGSAIKPAIVVSNNGKRLVEGTDYTVKYSNNIKACEWGKEGDAVKDAPKNAPKITVTGKGNFSGSTFTNFRIARKDIGETDTTDDTNSVEAGAITVAKNSKATPVLVYNGVKLGAKDYTYKDSTQKNQRFGDPSKAEAETFEIELQGAGNYTGSRTVTVKAVKKEELKTFTVTVGKVELTYDSTSKELPAGTVTVKDKKDKNLNLTEHTDYEIVYSGDTVSAGTVKFSVVGIGNYTGTVTKTYKIKPMSDSNQIFVDDTATKAGYAYDSQGVTPGDDIKVYYGSDATGTLLEEGTDYKLSYSKNKKRGTAGYTVTLQGNFKGAKKTGTFEIKEASLKDSEAKVESADKVFKKAGIYKSAPIVTINGVALKASDYKVDYYIVNADNTETLMGGKDKVTAAGTTIKVKVTGKGNYKAGDDNAVYGEYMVCDKGTKEDLSKAKVTFYEKNADGTKGSKAITKFDYTGRTVEPYVEVTFKGQTEPLTQDVDYTVVYVNNKNKGKATVIITAAGDSTKYVGSKTAKFSIVAKNLKTLPDLLGGLFKGNAGTFKGLFGF